MKKSLTKILNMFIIVIMCFIFFSNNSFAAITNEEEFNKALEAIQQDKTVYSLQLLNTETYRGYIDNYRTLRDGLRIIDKVDSNQTLTRFLSNWADFSTSSYLKSVSNDTITGAFIVAKAMENKGDYFNYSKWQDEALRYITNGDKYGDTDAFNRIKYALILNEADGETGLTGAILNYLQQDDVLKQTKKTGKEAEERYNSVMGVINTYKTGADYITNDYEKEVEKKSKEYFEDDPEITITPITSPLDNPLAYQPGELEDNTAITNKAKQVIGIINAIGIIVSVIALIIIGIKYMIAGVQEKAIYKQTMLPYIIGVIMLGAGTTLVNLLYNIGMGLW